MPNTDFWWLNSSQQAKYLYTELGHHRPIHDEEDPCSVKWDIIDYPIHRLDHWRERFPKHKRIQRFENHDGA